MTRFRSSAAYRIAFVYSAAIAIGIALLGTIVYWAMHVAFTRQLDAMLQDEVETLVLEYKTDGAAQFANAITDRERLRTAAPLYYAVFDRHGRRTLGSFDTSMPMPGLRDIAFVDPVEGPDEARGLVVDLPDRRRLVVAADREWIEQIDRTVLITFVAGFMAVIALGIGGALLLGGYLRRRLTAIGETAEAIIGGDLSRRMPTNGGDDEFDQLAGVLNAMLEEIERLLENLQQVSGDVAHDLRTPLTRLRNALEESASEPGGDDERGKVIADGINRVDEILSLFSAILRISEIESGQIKRLFVPVDVSALITDLAESYAPALRETGHELTWTVEPSILLSGDRELIAQAVINLIENAQGHTPAGVRVHIAAFETGSRIAIIVSDDGPGVAEADRALIVRRFIRLDSSRSQAGHGLGLNLVAAVARLHGGDLRFSDNAPGLVATLDLPKQAG